MSEIERSTLDCPPMKPLVLGCMWKGFGGNQHTCSIGVHVHRNRIELSEADAMFNNSRLTVIVSTREIDQEGLFDNGEEQTDYEVRGIADTAACSLAADKYSFRLTFPRDAVNIEDLLNCSSRNGTLTITAVETKLKPEKKKHPDVEEGKDRPRGQPAFEQLALAIRETELAKLCHDGTEKPVLSETLAFAMAQAGYSTLADLQNLMISKPQFWEGELLKIKGLGRAKLEQLTDAYQMHMTHNATADESRKNCNDCGQCYVGPKCDSCGSEFFQAVHDQQLSDEFEWPLDAVNRELVAESGGCRCEMLLKRCEFGHWHYGVYIIVMDAGDADETDPDGNEYGYQPSLVGNRLDEETARTRGLQALADEMIGVADDFPDHAGVKSCVEAVEKLID